MKPSSIRSHATARRLIVAIGLPLAGLGAFAVFRPHSEPAAPIAKAATAPSIAAPAPSTATPREWQWPAGSGAIYQIRQLVDITPGNGELGPETCGQTTLGGKLHVQLIDSQASSVSLAVQLSDMTVTVDPAGEAPPRRETVIERMLNSNAGLLELDRDGRVLSCRLPAALAHQDRTMLQGLLAIEFVLGEGTRWEADEKLQGAACRSFYQTSGGAAVAKTRQALPVPEGQPALHILKSGFTAVPGPFWIETLDGSEQLEYIWQKQRVCLANTTVKIVRHEETQTQTPHELAALVADPAKREALIDGASLTSHDESVRESARDRQHMARLVEQYEPIPASRMIDDLVEVVAGSDEHADTVPAMHALRDWLLANPSRSGEIAEGLKTADLSDSVTARMTHALELAGKKSKESQSALASIIGSEPGAFPPAVLMQAAVAAGGVGEVLSPELMPALSQMASAEDPGEDYSLSNAALFSLGSLARDNPELANNLVDTLSPMLETSDTNSAENQATALRALGNAGISDPALMEKALALRASHADAQVRIAAVDYFASLSSTEAVQALGKALAEDPSEDVRRVALNALTQPEFVSSERLRPVLDLIRQPGDGGTLLELAIANLAPFQNAFPEIRDAFRRLLPQARGKSADLLRQSLASNP